MVGHSECFFDFGFEPDRREAAACRHLNANAVAEDDCSGDVIQRQNATTPNRATVPALPCGNAALPQGSPSCRNRADPCRIRGLRRPERTGPLRAPAPGT